MTFGIDVSQAQSGIDYAQAKADGVEFVIVKAGGFNTGSLYVANGYAAHVNGARSQGLAIGHYFLVGRGSPTTQANFYVDHLHGFDPAHDVLALDNEPLNSNATFWTAAQVLEFFTVVQSRTGIPWDRLWLYCPAALTRAHAPWTAITNAGIRIWWAAYGGQPTGHIPDHMPALNGSVARADIHQYSSNVTIAGRIVDANFSNFSVGQLFGGSSSTASSGSTPILEGFLMALSDAEQLELLSLARTIAGYLYKGGDSVTTGKPGTDFDNHSVMGRVNALGDAVFNGGASMQDGGKSISQSLAEIHGQAAPGAGPVDYAAIAKAVNDDAAARLQS